jgi:hypothetical protein
VGEMVRVRDELPDVVEVGGVGQEFLFPLPVRVEADRPCAVERGPGPGTAWWCRAAPPVHRPAPSGERTAPAPPSPGPPGTHEAVRGYRREGCPGAPGC